MSKPKDTVKKEEAPRGLVPKLRFPEFRGAAGWSLKPLRAVAQINPANSALPESFIYIDLESVDDGALKTKTRISRIGAPSRAQRVVEWGDIIYQVVRPYQRNNLLCEFDDGNYVASTGYAQLRAKGSNRFLYHSIHTDSFVGGVIAKCTGSNYPAINSSDLAGIELPLPPVLAEQQKIAECLSSVDEVIAGQARKVDALKTHKKGLMQQLFPREGETQPRFRFPEFRNAGEWETKAVGDVFRVTRGDVLSMRLVKDEPSSEMPYPVFSSQTKSNGLAGYYSDYLYEDAITWTTDGANAGDVNFRSGKFYCTNVCGVLINTQGYTNTCVAALLNSVTRNHVSYVGNPKLMNGVMARIEIPFPPIEEQQRIADCLSSLDARIAAETQKLEALKTHKRGLMQQLFPSPEEAAA